MEQIIIEDVEKIIKKYIQDYSPNMRNVELKDLGDIDSLTIFNIMVDIEDHYDFTFGEEEDLERIFLSPATIIQYIEEKVYNAKDI